MVGVRCYAIPTAFVKRFYAPSTIGNAHLHSEGIFDCLLDSQSHGSHGGTFFQAGRNGAAEVIKADWLG
jgi:hypothetical protein